MKLGGLIEGLNILRPYYKGGDGYHIGCEHDQFYAYATDKPLSNEDAAKLKELGWFQPDVPEEDPYDPESGWSAFV